MTRILSSLALVVALAIAALTALRVERAWPIESHLSYAEGIWTAIAVDAADGTFYRPLDGPAGYGGTRYFPLFFTLHGGLIHAGLPPIIAGHVLATFAVVLLLAVMAALVRALGGDWTLATLAAALALACQPVQMALLTIRGDALAAAFAIAGLFYTVRHRTMAAAVCFALAFATKPTSLYAPAAAVLWLALDRAPRDAARLTARVAAGVAAVLLLMTIVSHGRALGVIAASAAGGGTFRSVLAAPVSAAHILRRVPESLFFMQIAAAIILARATTRPSLDRLAALLCTGATIAIFASPATVENHFIDLTALAVVVVIAWGAREPAERPLVLTLAIIGGVAALGAAAWRYQTEDRLDLRTARLDAVASVADVETTLLVEQPMLAAEVAQPAYLMDPYLFSVRIARDPAALDRLLADLAARRFGAVVLEHAALDLAVQDTFPGPAGARFLTALQQAYRLDRIVDGRPIFRPR